MSLPAGSRPIQDQGRSSCRLIFVSIPLDWPISQAWFEDALRRELGRATSSSRARSPMTWPARAHGWPWPRRRRLRGNGPKPARQIPRDGSGRFPRPARRH